MLACAVRIWVDNVPIRNRRTAGVQIPPKFLIVSNYAERGNAVRSPCARHGRQTVRHAEEGAVVRSENKQRPSGNEADRT